MVANPALTGFTAPKILWLRNHEPKNFAKLAKVLLPKDEIRRRLTGEFATEVSDASGMLLLDVVKRRWSKPLLAKLELDAGLLATCYESEEVTGKLTTRGGQDAGSDDRLRGRRRRGRLCGRGGRQRHRAARAAVHVDRHLGRGVRAQRRAASSIPQGRLHTFCHAVRGKWHMMGVTLSAGGSLQWFRNALCAADAAAAKGKKIDVYDLLDRGSGRRRRRRRGLVFPALSGRRAHAARRPATPAAHSSG